MKALTSLAIFCALCCANAFADDESALRHFAAAAAASSGNGATAPPTNSPPRAIPEAKSPPPVPAKAAPSAAERIARLQRAMEADERRLKELQNALDNPNSEFKKAEAEFKELDARRERRKKFEERLREEKFEVFPQQQAESEKLQREWQLAKERFDLAIQERKTLRENITSREEKLKKDREALEKLVNAAPVAPPAVPAPAPPPATAAAPTSGAPPASSPVSPPGQPPAPNPPSPASAPAAPQSPSTNLSSANSQPTTLPNSNKRQLQRSKELAAATDEVAQTEAAALEADEAARALTDRTEILLKNIDLERRLLETARKKLDNADETLRPLQEEIYKKYLAGAGPEVLSELRRKIADANDRRHAAHAEARQRAKHLDELQSEVAVLQADQIDALEEAKQRSRAAELARQRVAELSNPFAWRNIVAWLMLHGPRLLTIVMTMLSFFGISKFLQARLSGFLAKHNAYGNSEERENRARTLMGVMHSAAGVVILTGGTLMLLDEVGVPIAPLMGGAAMIGLAVAFGAQSLIKDYFSGFMILLEQQYMVNDVVRIGQISGQVERITMRVTVLRDLEGCVHFVPHGQVGSVTNMTHGWSRALVNVAVSYNEDLDRVISVLVELARALRRDPRFAAVILDDPEMLGVDELKDSSVMVKFFLKTRPLKQWTVKRELLRRIKNRFDELGIEIPYPHRKVLHQTIDSPRPHVQDGEEGGAARRVA